ncbi:hypothetical protein NQ315_013748 [Exocentrus adspersus]|uniref:C2H2-type domain-containing protein n=1 Tax=Exocentrus adspersus TaxID=1586481 RepID=A0AAV8W599_9CUCU|nr:hypothetical protein NQ315_013748 [Exocentrus adspersus]
MADIGTSLSALRAIAASPSFLPLALQLPVSLILKKAAIASLTNAAVGVVLIASQHAALIGGPNATSCPLCHKMFLGGEALMEHMKHTHKDPNASGVARLLSHMEHMRMDPKHQFAAQYVLSRAAAERRERESILAAVTSASGSGLLGLTGMGPASGSPMCASPSAHSDSSSGNGRLSSAGSEAGGLNNNNNNCNTKLGDILRNDPKQTSKAKKQNKDE